MVKRIFVTCLAVVAGIGVSTTDVWAAVGRTPGQFGVSAAGSAQYSIPIWTPPGPRGIQPNLSLGYDSHSGIGPLGVGWSLRGFGAITRCNKTYAQDANPTPANGPPVLPVELVTTDAYCLNGNRLRITSGTYGTTGSTYQTEIADFSNVTAYGTAGNGPQYFAVQGRDGLKYQYGYTDTNGNGANSAVPANGTSTVSEWLLSKVSDRAGNNYVINYTALTGTAVPNTILWTPTSAGAATYAYTMQFTYGTNVPQSSLTKYIGGTAVTNNQLLQSIEVSYSGTVVRDYFLTYQASPTTGRNELKTVTQCADAGESNCLGATTITYQPGGLGVSTTSSAGLSSSGSQFSARYDLNGDGIPDLVYLSGSTSYVAFGSTTGYGTPVNIGVVAVLVGNLNAGKEDGVLGVNGGTWWYYTWNGSTFTGVSTGVTYDSTAAQYQLADMDGDGLPDLISLYNTYNAGNGRTNVAVDARLNTSSGSTISFSSTLTAAYGTSSIGGGQLQTPDTQYGRLRRFDFNGDGRDDLAIEVVNGSPAKVYTYELISNGTVFTATQISAVAGIIYPPAFFTNWNDDACTDYVAGGDLYISGCNGSVATSYTVGNVLAAMDWDGDGRTDLVVANGSTLGVYLSTGGAVSTLLSTSIPYTSTCQYVTLDANGDGLDDLGCLSGSGSNPLTYYLHNGAFSPPDLVSSFTDGFGNSVTLTYESITEPSGNYSALNDQVFPYLNYLKPFYVVVNTTFSDPSSASGGTYGVNYYYSGAAYNLQGRGFAGFGARQSYDSRNEIWSTFNYDRVFPYTGMLSSRVSAQDNLNMKPITTVTPALTYLTLDSTAYNQRYFPYASASTTKRYEVGGSKNTQLITAVTTNYGTPDNYGNFDSVSATVTDEDSGSPYYGDTWTSTIASTIAPQTGSWCLNLPTQTTVTNSSTAPNGSAITRTMSYTPDYTNCRETGTITEPSSSTYKVTEVYGFDAFGNLNSDSVTGVGMPARVTMLGWGTTGQFLTTIQNALSQSITLGFDPKTGMQNSRTDLNYTTGNPLQTTWAYDGFGRKTQATLPDGTYTVWAYNDCATEGGCLFGTHALALSYYLYAKGGTLLNEGTTYFDTIGRPVMAKAELLSGYNRNEVRYDSLGRVVKQAMPCTYTAVATSCTYWATNYYDILNRLTQSQRPISASDSSLQTTTYGYAGRTTTTQDALMHTTTKIAFVTGRLGRSQDALGYYQNFSYDAFGALKSVTDSASNALFSANYAYGLSAFQTSSSDMDLGARSYTIDALGEMTAYSDAKSQSFTQTYDALSRPLIRTEPDLTTTWTWGNTAASYNIGKLQSVTAAGSNGTYAESYGFDSLTRLQTDSIAIPSDSTYTYSFAYNATTGLLNTLTYPTSTAGYSLTLQYGYTNGILQQVNDANSSTVFWQNTGMNPRGQVTQETLGNGIVTNRTFDAVTGWVAGIQSGAGGGSTVQNQSYQFDVDGNVTQRQDNNEGLNENFYYDADNRLDHSTLNGTLNLQMTYDGGSPGPGNITARSDVAGGSAWTYDSVRKHAVTQAGTGGYAFTYDANGNATSRNGYNITWSSYNYPISINGLNKNVALYYGPNRRYYEQIYTDGSSTEKTIYAGGLLEKVTVGSVVDWRHYIRVNNELVAIMSRKSSGTNVTHYTLSDHQGSIAQVTDGSAATTVTESFSAFGTRRNPSAWSGMPTCPDLCTIASISREGYTGHNAIGGVSLGLNHMNGRVQDAITGRFLSPDPTVPNPSNTQSFNRYTYVNNNPLTMIDPSGFDGCNDQGCVKPIDPPPDSGPNVPTVENPSPYGLQNNLGGIGQNLGSLNDPASAPDDAPPAGSPDSPPPGGTPDSPPPPAGAPNAAPPGGTPDPPPPADDSPPAIGPSVSSRTTGSTPTPDSGGGGSGSAPNSAPPKAAPTQNFLASNQAFAAAGLLGKSRSNEASESGSMTEGISDIVGEVGIGMDTIKLMSSTKIMASATEFFSKYSMAASVGLDGYQAYSSSNSEDAAFHLIDAAADYGASRIGVAGLGVSIVWTAVGGAKGLSRLPNPNPDYVFPY